MRRSLTVCLVMFALYNLLVYLMPLDQPRGLNSRAVNLIAAESFLYAPEPKRGVIVGSSMAARLILEELPAGTSNVSFGGGGVQTGLELIKLRPTLPEFILVESNSATMLPDRELLGNVSHPLLFRVRKYVPAMRVQNQPTTYSISSALSGLGRLASSPSAGRVNWTRPPAETYRAMLELAKKSYAQSPDSVDYERGLAELTRYVETYRGRGVRVILFEMPIDDGLEDSPSASFQRRRMERWARDMRIPSIPLDPQGGYETTDGIHLTSTAAARYTRYVAAQLRALDP